MEIVELNFSIAQSEMLLDNNMLDDVQMKALVDKVGRRWLATYFLKKLADGKRISCCIVSFERMTDFSSRT